MNIKRTWILYLRTSLSLVKQLINNNRNTVSQQSHRQTSTTGSSPATHQKPPGEMWKMLTQRQITGCPISQTGPGIWLHRDLHPSWLLSYSITENCRKHIIMQMILIRRNVNTFGSVECNYLIIVLLILTNFASIFKLILAFLIACIQLTCNNAGVRGVDLHSLSKIHV